jgi:single-strand DNA-binding protein
MYRNRVMITGFVGRPAETRTGRNDRSITTFSVATKRSWKNRATGAYHSQTTWHKCVVFGPQATFAATLLKGTHVQIDGELRTREYTDQAGSKRSMTEIRVFRITKLDRAAKPEREGAAA